MPRAALRNVMHMGFVQVLSAMEKIDIFLFLYAPINLRFGYRKRFKVVVIGSLPACGEAVQRLCCTWALGWNTSRNNSSLLFFQVQCIFTYIPDWILVSNFNILPRLLYNLIPLRLQRHAYPATLTTISYHSPASPNNFNRISHDLLIPLLLLATTHVHDAHNTGPCHCCDSTGLTFAAWTSVGCMSRLQL